MVDFHIISHEIDGLLVHTKTFSDGTSGEEIGDAGYRSIIMRLVSDESEEKLKDFMDAISRETSNGNTIRLELEENDAQALKLKSLLSLFDGVVYNNFGEFVTATQLCLSINTTVSPKI